MDKKPPPPKPKKPLEPEDALEILEEGTKPEPPALPTVIGVPAIADPRPKAPAPKPAPAAKPAAKVEAPPGELIGEKPLKPNIPTLLGTPAPRIVEKDDEEDGPIVSPLGSKDDDDRDVNVEDDDAPAMRPDPLEQARKAWKNLREGPKPRFIAFVSIAGLVGLVFVGVIIKLIAGGPSEETPPVASASASASNAPVATTSTSSSATTPSKPITCAIAGAAQVIAPHATLSAGLEAVPLDSSIGVGFASDPKEATVVVVDPADLGSPKVRTATNTMPIKRVTPNGTSDAIDVDAAADKITARRTVGAYDIGVHGKDVVYAPHGTSDTKVLWSLEKAAPVEALRGTMIPEGLLVVYRHDAAIWFGLAKGATMDGSPPHRIEGLGQVGSPTIAVSDGTALSVWADREGKDSSWGLRYAIWKVGGDAPTAKAFTVPPGGLGENAMSPSVTALPGGRFFLAWTEGPWSNQQVRATVIGNDGTPMGAVLAISADGIHAGQGQAALLPSGKGIVAYFSAPSPKAFEVRATSIVCN